MARAGREREERRQRIEVEGHGERSHVVVGRRRGIGGPAVAGGVVGGRQAQGERVRAWVRVGIAVALQQPCTSCDLLRGPLALELQPVLRVVGHVASPVHPPFGPRHQGRAAGSAQSPEAPTIVRTPKIQYLCGKTTF